MVVSSPDIANRYGQPNELPHQRVRLDIGLIYLLDQQVRPTSRETELCEPVLILSPYDFNPQSVSIEPHGLVPLPDEDNDVADPLKRMHLPPMNDQLRLNAGD